MIIQGSNQPIEIAVTFDMSDDLNIEAGLYNDKGEEMKSWGKDDMVVSDYALYLPITEEESMSFSAGAATLEVKWLVGQRVYCAEQLKLWVDARFNDTPVIKEDENESE